MLIALFLCTAYPDCLNWNFYYLAIDAGVSTDILSSEPGIGISRSRGPYSSTYAQCQSPRKDRTKCS